MDNKKRSIFTRIKLAFSAFLLSAGLTALPGCGITKKEPPTEIEIQTQEQNATLEFADAVKNGDAKKMESIIKSLEDLNKQIDDARQDAAGNKEDTSYFFDEQDTISYMLKVYRATKKLTTLEPASSPGIVRNVVDFISTPVDAVSEIDAYATLAGVAEDIENGTIPVDDQTKAAFKYLLECTAEKIESDKNEKDSSKGVPTSKNSAFQVDPAKDAKKAADNLKKAAEKKATDAANKFNNWADPLLEEVPPEGATKEQAIPEASNTNQAFRRQVAVAAVDEYYRGEDTLTTDSYTEELAQDAILREKTKAAIERAKAKVAAKKAAQEYSDHDDLTI